MNMKLACITPVLQIKDFDTLLKNNFDSYFLERPSKEEVKNLLIKEGIDIIFTNPNQQGFKIDESLLLGSKVKIICTASTGLNHIDTNFCEKNNVKIISITKELETLNQITSTAELAFCLMLMSVRNITNSLESVKQGEWTWEPFLGRQIKDMSIGVVGYGRLGKMFANYCKAFYAKVLVYDPFIIVEDDYFEQKKSLEDIFVESDVVSLHVHVNDLTRYMINSNVLKNAKHNLILINTSRGEIVNESDVYKLLSEDKIKHYACDVLEKEFDCKVESPLLKLEREKVTITPHIGGSTLDAQKIAYKKSLDLLLEFIKNEINS